MSTGTFMWVVLQKNERNKCELYGKKIMLAEAFLCFFFVTYISELCHVSYSSRMRNERCQHLRSSNFLLTSAKFLTNLGIKETKELSTSELFKNSLAGWFFYILI